MADAPSNAGDEQLQFHFNTEVSSELKTITKEQTKLI